MVATEKPFVLQVTPFHGRKSGGLGSSVESLSNELNKRREVDSETLVLFPRGPINDRVYVRRVKPNGESKMVKLGGYLERNRNRIDIVHFHSPIFGKTDHGLELILDSLPSASMLTTHHAVDYSPGEGMERLQQASQRLLHFTINNMLASLGPCIGYPGIHKSVIIPNGAPLPTEEKQDKRVLRKLYSKEFPIEDDDLVLLYVGRIAGEKGLRRLSNAFPIIERRLKKDYGINSKLIFVGGGNESLKRELEKNVESCIGKVHFADRVTDTTKLYAFYTMSDLLIIPSDRESFCLAAVDGFLRGLPVAITDNYGPNELFTSRGIAIGMQPTPESIIEAVIWTVENPEEIARMLDHAKQVAKREFTIEESARRTTKLYQHMADAGKQSLEAYSNGLKAMREGRSNDALRCFEGVIGRDITREKKLVEMYKLARWKGYNGNPENSKVLFERITQEDPYHREAFVELGRLYFREGRLEEAGQRYKKAADLDSKNPGLNYITYHCFKDSDNSGVRKLAEWHLHQAKKIDPNIETKTKEVLDKIGYS
ncbi:glycosyltransferase [Candidatus Woesearchaeota archaeon]|nr:glycosyltransferase [Candidatus Woesearchaeota archaeon]